MAQFTVTITVPDGNLTAALNGLKRVEPVINGESNLAYIRRITALFLTDRSIEGQALLQREAIAITHPDITTS